MRTGVDTTPHLSQWMEFGRECQIPDLCVVMVTIGRGGFVLLRSTVGGVGRVLLLDSVDRFLFVPLISCCRCRRVLR